MNSSEEFNNLARSSYSIKRAYTRFFHQKVNLVSCTGLSKIFQQIIELKICIAFLIFGILLPF